MLQEANRLNLDENSMQIIKQYKNIEEEIYYTLQYQKQQFPVLPMTEEGLFLSKFELSLEKCQAQKHEIDWPTVSSEYEDEDEDNQAQDSQDDQFQNNEQQSQESEISQQQDFGINQITCLNIFIKDRNPREINIPVQPISLFDGWLHAMDLEFDNMKPKTL